MIILLGLGYGMIPRVVETSKKNILITWESNYHKVQISRGIPGLQGP